MLVAQTRTHARYEASYKPILLGPLPAGWRETQRSRGLSGGSRQGFALLGLDCEMVETSACTNAVARITVVAHGMTLPGVVSVLCVSCLCSICLIFVCLFLLGKFPCAPRVLLDLYVKPEGAAAMQCMQCNVSAHSSVLFFSLSFFFPRPRDGLQDICVGRVQGGRRQGMHPRRGPGGTAPI